MCERTLPLLFCNLGGEMLYVLDQRLRAQDVQVDKANKVMNDIVSTMFNKKFIDQIFNKHQPLYSRRVMKTMFDKLAHASIMRLNSASMDKLYDLMTMSVKHQVLMCHNPYHLISVTLNHLDAILGYLTSQEVRESVEVAFNNTVHHYAGMSIFEMQSIRHSMLGFFQDIHVRVSIFLNEGIQHNNGRFVKYPSTTLYPGVEPPGQIRFLDSCEEIRETINFFPGEKYSKDEGELGLSIGGLRPTPLGSNMYSGRHNPVDHLREVQDSGRVPAVTAKENGVKISTRAEEEGVSLATEELNLLAKLIGTGTANTNKEFRLNLFDGDKDEEKEEERKEEQDDRQINIDLKGRRDRGDLDKIISEMTVEVGDDEEDDLLSLMDKAS